MPDNTFQMFTPEVLDFLKKFAEWNKGDSWDNQPVPPEGPPTVTASANPSDPLREWPPQYVAGAPGSKVQAAPNAKSQYDALLKGQ